MRKKRLSSILKILSILMALGLVFYHKTNFADEPMYIEEYHAMNSNSSGGSGFTDHSSNHLDPVAINIFHESADAKEASTAVGVPENRHSSSGSFSMRSMPGHSYSNASQSSSHHIESHTIHSSGGNGPGQATYGMNFSVQVPKPDQKKKKEKQDKNSFGTTIASRPSGIGTQLEQTMAPGTPPDSEEVPLDGGTWAILIIGVFIALYKLLNTSTMTFPFMNADKN